MIKYLQLPTCKLAEFSAAGDTSFTVSGFLLNDGITPVASADIGDICYATLEPKTAREELISFTIASVTSAGVATVTAVRGLLQKSPYTTGGATFDHQNGSDFVISNNPGLFNQLTAKDNLEVITAQWSFPSPTANASPVTKSYADALVINGGAEATNTTRGIALLSVSPDVTIGTATISIATPAVVSFVAHGLLAGDSIRFTTTGALPTGLVVGTRYFVMVAGLVANAFQVSLTVSGAAINTSGTQSGVHTLIETTPIAVGFNDTIKLPTVAEKAALAGAGNFGTPSASNKYITQNYNSSATGLPVVRTYLAAASPATWTKPVGLKYIKVQVQAAGGGGAGYDTDGTDGPATSGSGGGYCEKIIAAASLGATETVTIGGAGTGGNSAGTPTSGTDASNTTFGSHVTAGGGIKGTANNSGIPAGGTATGGDLNIPGGTGSPLFGSQNIGLSWGGDSFLGKGSKNFSSVVSTGSGYGFGGAGGSDSGFINGQAGGPALVTVTEYYS